MELVKIERDILLSPFTTLKLGGKADFFARCHSEDDIFEALAYGKKNNLPAWILGTGSNTIFGDFGFRGIVLKIELNHIEKLESNNENFSLWRVGAGVSWDEFVKTSLDHGCVGIECLSGIPGTVGASPIQNIGAYGQEVSESIQSVRVILENLDLVTIDARDCGFRYRDSRFKSGSLKKSIITEVIYALSNKNPITLKYPEVEKKWKGHASKMKTAENRKETLIHFREMILGLRRAKSMVLDDTDLNSRSVGSFFMNPLLSLTKKEEFLSLTRKLGLIPPKIYLDQNELFKVSAAWLIENSGFKKGMRFKGVGLSSAHCLALINVNGTSQELIDFSEVIRKEVFSRFAINLEKEPVFAQ